MIIYHREKQTIVIPAAFGEGVSIAPQDCEEAIAEAYQSGWTGGQEEIENSAITLSVTENGTYSADTGNNIYFKNVEVNVNRNAYRYEVTFYYDGPNGSPDLASLMPDMSINSNNVEEVWYAGLIWATNIYKTTYLYDLVYLEPQISGITSFDITLHIRNETAPDALRCVRVNGADFAITSQTREYLGTDEDNYSHWVFHLIGTLPSIPPYDYFDLTSVEVKMSGINSLNDGLTLEFVGVDTTTTYEYTNLSGGTLDYGKNISISKFGSTINMVNNQFIAADLANRGIRIYVSPEDFALWDNDWSVTELRINGFANNGNYQGGISIPIKSVDVNDMGEYKIIDIK